MKKMVLTCGLTAGIISVIWPIFGEHFLNDGVSYNMRVVFGYAAMIVAFSVIFVGVKKYRDSNNGGFLSFGGALKMSLLIALVASVIYTAAWLVNYYFFMPEFGAKYMASVRAQLVAAGTAQAEIQKQMAEIAAFMQQYKNPFFNAATTFCEIAPVGIIMSLVCALTLKRKPVTQVTLN